MIRVIVAPSYHRARHYMDEQRINPRHVRIVTDIDSAERVRAMDLKEDEVAWIALPASFNKVVEKIVRSAING